MKFSEVVAQTITWLQRDGRVSYRALQREFDLDDEFLEDLKAEIIDAKRLAVDENSKVLVWVGDASVASSQSPVPSSSPPPAPQTSDFGLRTPDLNPQTPDPRRDTAERRQLTVMFCDLVGSTTLSTQLDPEELREVVRAYQQTCAQVISRFDGHLAKYLGDGLLVYFGYPVAHEDDAQRAVRAGLGIITALQHLLPVGHEVPSPLAGEGQGEGAKVSNVATLTPHLDLPPRGGKEKTRLTHRLQVRIGIHTGLVVAGEMGGGDTREPLAIVGETPNVAARLQEIAVPDTVVISTATYRLIQGYFECQDLGFHTLKGISTPVPVYQVLEESGAQSRFEVAVTTGLTPLMGREQEVGLVVERWERVKDGEGQVVLLSGEAGIGKSRLVQELKERVAREGCTRIEFRCSPYYQNTAFYPVIDHLQRLLQFRREDSSEEKLRKLEVGAQRAAPLRADTIPLLAALLSLPHPKGYPPLTLSPAKQKQKTQEALIAWLLAEAERKPVLAAWEDLHWADPSTLELHGMLLDQAPTARILTLLTFRPEFSPPWGARAHLTPLTLNRLGRKQVEAMVAEMTSGKALPAEVVRQIVAKTDGVPLFVEELTKTVLESQFDVGARLRPGFSTGHVPLPLDIPATLHDSLMARLDRLGAAKEVAQVAATLGREFSYDLLQSVSPLAEASLPQALAKLVEAEVLYQRGLPPQARYVFKHALIQDTAYQSLLKSTRQQYHRQIAQVLAERFPETVETQPELVAQHYTEACLIAQAIPYWQRAGQRAIGRSAHVEAISHLTRGLELLKTLPDTPERAQQELTLQTALGGSLMAIKGYAAPEAGKAYARARELCRQVGETPQLFSVLGGLATFYIIQGELRTGRELVEQLLRLAQSLQNPVLLQAAHHGMGEVLFHLGELPQSRTHLEQAITLYDPQKRRFRAFHDPGVACLSVAALTLWSLGYPDQALQRIRESLTLARELSHPFILSFALYCAAGLYQFRREVKATQEQTEALIALSHEQGFTLREASGVTLRGWALAEQGRGEEGIAQIRQGLAATQALGADLLRPHFLALLAEAYGKAEQGEQGLAALAEALAFVDKTGQRQGKAELYRLKGELTLKQSGVLSSASEVPNTHHPPPSTQTEAEAEARRVGIAHQNVAISEAGAVGGAHPTREGEAEEYFWQAIKIARRQQAKSLELRAVVSLSRLWQKQGRKEEARKMLAEIYNWFTEGFDTKDLQEAQELLEELNH